MAGNTLPIVSKVGQIEWGATAITTANTALDGTGTVVTVFTADATNGGFVQKLRAKLAVGTGSSTATVMRIFINNGAANTTAANNILFDEITLPITAGSQSVATQFYEVPINLALPPGFKLNVTIGTTSANGWFVIAIGGKY